MKKVFVSTIIIVAFVLYSIFNNKHVTAALPVTKSTSQETDVVPSTSTQEISTTPSASSRYADGTYTGSEANAFYGYIQVQATVSGGKLTDVTFLQYPNDEGHSIRINQLADPILAQEAIQAQSAKVDIVSGATDTSEAFIKSLQSALNQAQS